MKNIIGIALLLAMIGISTATEIRFSPDHGDIKNSCMVAADIIVDTANQSIAATDVVIQSSMEYVDFVPNKEFFPYFFPPKVDQTKNRIHIIGFVANAKKIVSGTGSIGKIFFKQKLGNEIDGTIKLYFAGTGETYDTNLSILGGIDVLDTVGSGYYRFSESGTCEYPADYDIIGGFSHKSADEALKKTINQIKRRQRRTRRNIIPLTILIIITIVLFIYKRHKDRGTGK